ncbi:MAG: UDP-diphosphatase, partial [Bifidobacterium crudilactis]|nr:UDP-diphosphatase [Bifidobacterium crudilactis]
LVIIAFLKIVSTFSSTGFAVYRIAIAIVVALLLITGALAPLAGSAA